MMFRIRHLKCDELKPICNRCATTGLRCDGYMYQYHTRQSQTEPESKPKAAPKPLIRAQIPASSIEPSLSQLMGSNEDKKQVYFFRTVTVPRLTGHFEPESWTSRLLQISLPNPNSGVWHSILAPGTSHEEFMVSHETARTNAAAARRFIL